MKLRKLTLVLAAAALLLAQADTALQRAIRKETVEGDLKGAIELYQKAISQAGKDRATVAQALLRLGDCYEKQGDKQARPAYERLVKEFGDSKEASQAKVKLAAMSAVPGGGGNAKQKEMICQNCARYDRKIGGIDKPLLAHVDAARNLAVMDLVTGQTRILVHSHLDSGESAAQPVISADGTLLVYKWYMKDRSEIRSIGTDGTGMRTLLTSKAEDFLFPQALSPDKRTVLLGEGHLQALSLVDGSLKNLEIDKPNSISFSPDGKQIAYAEEARNMPGSRPNRRLVVANADGSGARPLLDESRVFCQRPIWTADGKWIVFESNRTGSVSLWAISPAGGEPRQLDKESNVELIGIARDGAVYYSTQASQPDIEIVRVDPATLTPAGEPSRLIDTFLGRNSRPSFSPDGRWFAWSSERGGGDSMVVRPAAGGEETIMAQGSIFFQGWFPDGGALLRLGYGDNQFRIERVGAPDGRVTEIYRSAGGAPRAVTVAPDGKALLWLRCGANASSGRPCSLVRYDLATKSESAQAIDGMNAAESMAASPDGKWLAVVAQSESTGAAGQPVLVMPAAGGKLVEVAKAAEGERLSRPVWTPDSKQILYSVWVDDLRGLRREFRAVAVGGGTPRTIPLNGAEPSFSPDGRLAYTKYSYRSELWVARNLLPSN